MYRKNNIHQQPALISAIRDLPEKQRVRLEQSWAGSLRSLEDLEDTYRTKGTQHYKGYVANVTETCDPENELQLITKIQVASNNTADSHLLQEALPNLKQRTQLETLWKPLSALSNILPQQANCQCAANSVRLYDDRISHSRECAKNSQIPNRERTEPSPSTLLF